MKIAIYNRCGVLNDVVVELKNRGHTIFHHNRDNNWFGWEKADVIVVWVDSEMDGWRKSIIKAQRYGKKVILVQHGRKGISRAHPPFNEVPITDLVCVWSENDKKRLIECGYPEEKIVITGTPIFRHLIPREKHKGKIIVFTPTHWDANDETENVIVANKLRQLEDVKIITKIVYTNDPKHFDNPVFSDVSEQNHFTLCADVLSKADLVVSLVDSTFELMAEILDIPVVVMDMKIPSTKYKINLYPLSNACTGVKDISKLNDEIRKHLSHPELLREERKTIGVRAAGMDIKDPVEEMIKAILTIKK